MKFDVLKKGYDKDQVNEYIQNITNENNEIITNLKSEIDELKKQNEELSKVVNSYENKKDEIFVAFVEAQETAAKLKARAEKRFEDEMERLQLFRQKWTTYAKQVVKNLVEEQAQKFEQASQKFEEILAIYAKEVKVLQPEKPVEQKPQQDKTFNPLKKVEKFLNNFEQVEKPVQKPVVEEQVAEQPIEQVAEEVVEQVEQVAEQIVVEKEVEQVVEEQTIVEQNVVQDVVAEMSPEIEELVEELLVKPTDDVEQQPQPEQSQQEQIDQKDEQDEVVEVEEQVVEYQIADDNANQVDEEVVEQDKNDLQDENKDIQQSEIFNVQQSLEDLCKELGLID